VLVTVPPGVVTAIAPVVEPVGIVAVILVALFTVKLVAAVPFTVTAVAPVKLLPVSVTVEPIGPDVGVNDVIVGAGAVTVKELVVVVPKLLVTVIVPVVAPEGTFVLIISNAGE
jgi:hypothetical protein